jgi:hypothetical protein
VAAAAAASGVDGGGPCTTSELQPPIWKIWGYYLAGCCSTLVCFPAYPSTLKIEAIISSEASVGFQLTTQRYSQTCILIAKNIVLAFEECCYFIV